MSQQELAKTNVRDHIYAYKPAVDQPSLYYPPTAVLLLRAATACCAP